MPKNDIVFQPAKSDFVEGDIRVDKENHLDAQELMSETAGAEAELKERDRGNRHEVTPEITKGVPITRDRDTGADRSR